MKTSRYLNRFLQTRHICATVKIRDWLLSWTETQTITSLQPEKGSLIKSELIFKLYK